MVAHARSGRDGTGAGAGRDHPVEAAEDWRGGVAQPAPHPTAVEQPPSLSAALRPGGPGVGQRLQRGEDCPGTLKNNGGWGALCPRLEKAVLSITHPIKTSAYSAQNSTRSPV